MVIRIIPMIYVFLFNKLYICTIYFKEFFLGKATWYLGRLLI